MAGASPLIGIEGLRQRQRELRQFDDEVKAMLKDAAVEAAQPVVRYGKALAPHRTGRLQKSIRAARQQSGVVVRAGTASIPYAPVIHFGSPKKHIRPQPFLYRASDDRAEEVTAIYEARLLKIQQRYQ